MRSALWSPHVISPTNSDRLVKTPPGIRLSQLSKHLYEEFLHEATTSGFAFVKFSDFLPGSSRLPSRFIALRHDIDFAPELSLEMAKIEHAVGVSSTYFVLVDGEFYSPVDKAVVQQIRGISGLGHEIGLHFSIKSSAMPNLADELAWRLELLSVISGTEVRSVSQHDPVNAGFAAVELPDGYRTCVDVSQVIREFALLYVSDSAMMWREHTFLTALDQQRNLCLLAHPHSWLYEGNDYIEMIRRFQAAEEERLAGKYDRFVGALSNYYQRRLAEGV